MKLKFLGFDFWDNAIYKDCETGKLWCDFHNLGKHVPAGYKGVTAECGVCVSAPNIDFVSLYTMTNNEIDGEPSSPIKDGITVEFVG